MLDSRSQWVVGSALLDCWSSIHRLHWSTGGVESVAVGFRVCTNKLLPVTMVAQTRCPFCSIHWNWYCLVTMVLELLQMAKQEMALWKFPHPALAVGSQKCRYGWPHFQYFVQHPFPLSSSQYHYQELGEGKLCVCACVYVCMCVYMSVRVCIRERFNL